MGDLEGNGLTIKYSLLLCPSVACDAPARAFLKRIKRHSGYSGCDKCTQPGVYNSKMTFPEVEQMLHLTRWRTHTTKALVVFTP